MKYLVMLFFSVCLCISAGCSRDEAAVVQPDPETRTYPQTEVGESMEDVQ